MNKAVGNFNQPLETAVSAIPISLYVHVPWCVRRCDYCDFNAHALQGDLPEAVFLSALEADLIQDLPLLGSRPLISVFIGGGTPSLLSTQALSALLSMINRHCRLAEDVEITLEANPGTLEHKPLSAYVAAGITRLSLGVQSFNQEKLNRLGRIHSPGEAEDSIEEALSAGFASVNVDLMYGLPDQKTEEACLDLKRALDFGCPHLSWYQLTIEPNTVFYWRRPGLPAESDVGEMEQAGLALLADAGLERYEVSAYARAGHRCRHNLNYWQYGDYIGIGPGAASKLTNAQLQVRRRCKVRQPSQYLHIEKPADFLAEDLSIMGVDRSFEYLLNALRLVDGVDETLYQARTGQNMSELESWRARNLKKGLLRADGRLGASRLGLRFLDELVADFNV